MQGLPIDLVLAGASPADKVAAVGREAERETEQRLPAFRVLQADQEPASLGVHERLAENLSRLQRAFSAHHALQCGYCTPGMLMSATALLRANPHPSEGEIKKALQGNICRCTGYWNIFEAVKAASE